MSKQVICAVRLTPDQAEKLKTMARETERSRSAVLRYLLENAIRTGRRDIKLKELDQSRGEERAGAK